MRLPWKVGVRVRNYWGWGYPGRRERGLGTTGGGATLEGGSEG